MGFDYKKSKLDQIDGIVGVGLSLWDLLKSMSTRGYQPVSVGILDVKHIYRYERSSCSQTSRSLHGWVRGNFSLFL